MSAQGLIVTIVVVAAGAYIVRRIYRMLAGKPGGGCGCNSCPARTAHPKSR